MHPVIDKKVAAYWDALDFVINKLVGEKSSRTVTKVKRVNVCKQCGLPAKKRDVVYTHYTMCEKHLKDHAETCKRSKLKYRRN